MTGQTKLPKLLFLSAAIVLISVLVVTINCLPAQGRTLPVHGEPKPDGFVIFLPFADDAASHMSYYSYGSPGSNHVGVKYYSIDFSLGRRDVYPVTRGRVTYSGDNPTYGKVVVIEHSEAGFTGYVSVYAHLDSIYAYGQLGQVVNPDHPIGVEGQTGSANGVDHLHFELRHCSEVPYGNLPSNDTSICKSVVPEPFIGRHVYEGFGWWHTLKPSALAGGASRPIALDDHSPPYGEWEADASADNSFIVPGKPIVFDVRYWDEQSEVGEIRLTAGYQNRNWTDWTGDGFDAQSVWRIVARCDPRDGLCGSNRWRLAWDPYQDCIRMDSACKQYNDIDGYLPIPWLPKPDPIQPGEQVDICISFDIFDTAGNAMYAPAGVQCLSTAQNESTSLDLAQANNEARLIHVLPYADNLPSPDSAIFVSDIALPDGTVVSPGQALHKVWRVRNSGTSTWGSGYQLVFMGGDQMGAPTAVNLPGTVSPGATVDLAVDMTAPSAPGSYTGYWRLRNPQGTYFGPTIHVRIASESASGYITTLAADPPSPSEANSVRIHARAEAYPNFRAMRLKIDGNVVYELGAPEFYYDWNTSGYAAGEHSIVAEIADQTDTSWSRPERRAVVYTLLGNPVKVNHAPNRPTPTSPHDWYVNYSGNTATLCAQDAGDPDGDPITGYYFDIYDSAQLWNSGWVSGNCVTTASLGPYGYKWHVKVRDSHGAESDWSDSWHFTLVNPSLTITELYFEPQDAKSERVKIRACTEGQAGIGITMRVSVNDASDGSESGQWHVIYELGVPCFNETDAPIWNTLGYGDGTHKVRVEAHGMQTGWDGAAARDATYTLPHRRPGSPGALRPVNAADPGQTVWVDSRTIAFAWEPALRASQYRLCASLDTEACLNPILDVALGPSTTNHTYTFDSDYEHLHWEVFANNDQGSTGSGTVHLGIDRTVPACIVQTLPSTTYESIFQVRWSGSDNAAGVREFDIQYMDSDRGTWSDWLTDMPSTKTYELFSGKAGHTYHFRCRALDNANNLSSYPAVADTFTTIDPSARPAAPWWNVAYSEKRNLIIQNNDDNTLPVHFPLHLHFDNATVPTAAEVYNASLAAVKGNDVRVVYGDQTELHRFVQRFTSSQIDIWFPLQVALGSGSTDSAHYQLYYGNAGAGTPPADVNMVFLPLADSSTIGLWHFQDSPGTSIHDTSGNANHGTFSNGSWVNGFTGWAGGFNATNTAVTIPHSSVFNVSAITIEVWMYLTDFDDLGYPIAMKRKPYTRGGFELHMTHDREFTWLVDDYGMNSGYALTLNRWHHLAVTSNGTDQLCAFVDGVQVRCQEGGPVNPVDAPITIGYYHSPEGELSFPGYIQHVRVSNIARTSFPYARIDIEASVAAGDPIQPPDASFADLAILDLDTYPNPDGGVLVQAVVQNHGERNTVNGFYTDLYANHLPSGPGDYTGSARFWVNEPIAAGSTVTLTAVLPDITAIAAHDAIDTSPVEETTFILYGQTDSGGVVTESDEADNISDGVDVCIASPDVYEGDDGAGNAQPIALGETQSHNFDRSGDEDWLRFTAEAGQAYILETSNLSPASDTYLYLYDTDGSTLLAANDDYGGGLASQVEWETPAAGTYFVLVSHWNPNAGGCGTSYEISVTPSATRQSVYLPLVASRYRPLMTMRIYGDEADGELGRLFCEDWEECRDNSSGNYLVQGYPFGTISVGFEAPYFDIRRIFLYFDTSALEPNVVIEDATLWYYSGSVQSGDTLLHVVRSTAGIPLSRDHYDDVQFQSGGSATSAANAWVSIGLNAAGLDWIARGGVTKLALVHDKDLNNVVPDAHNDTSVALTENLDQRPFLTLTYYLP